MYFKGTACPHFQVTDAFESYKRWGYHPSDEEKYSFSVFLSYGVFPSDEMKWIDYEFDCFCFSLSDERLCEG